MSLGPCCGFGVLCVHSDVKDALTTNQTAIYISQPPATLVSGRTCLQPNDPRKTTSFVRIRFFRNVRRRLSHVGRDPTGGDCPKKCRSWAFRVFFWDRESRVGGKQIANQVIKHTHRTDPPTVTGWPCAHCALSFIPIAHRISSTYR